MKPSASQILLCICYAGVFLFPYTRGCTLAEVNTCIGDLLETELIGLLFCPDEQLQCLKKLTPSASINSLIKVFNYICSDAGGEGVGVIFGCVSKDSSIIDQLAVRHNECLGVSGWNTSVPLQCTSAQQYASCLHTAARQYCDDPQSIKIFDHLKMGFIEYGCFEDCSGASSTTLLNIGTLLMVALATMMTAHSHQLL